MCVFCQELVKMVSNQKDKREDRFPEPLKKCLAPKEKNFFSEWEVLLKSKARPGQCKLAGSKEK